MTTNAIKYVLDDLGIRPNTRGYHYMFLAISLLLEDSTSFENAFQTKLYPEIGKIYNRTPESIVVTLQRSVSFALDNGDPDLLYAICGAPIEELPRKPTCAKFILQVVRYLEEN